MTTSKKVKKKAAKKKTAKKKRLRAPQMKRIETDKLPLTPSHIGSIVEAFTGAYFMIIGCNPDSDRYWGLGANGSVIIWDSKGHVLPTSYYDDSVSVKKLHKKVKIPLHGDKK